MEKKPTKKKAEKLTEQEVKELMGVDRQIYMRRGSAIVRKGGRTHE
ncbi:hypothetical protein G4V62_12510 [Bacillaceae bacterium SIJ1]|nr:hypothetical protein [Litoribacterium kuwaitense]NGP45737.1 hypothetical protein [Litoribacterium kuwaitense]